MRPSSFKNTPTVCLSMRLSHRFDNVPAIVSSWIFQDSLPLVKVMSMQKIKVRGQRSRSKPYFPQFGRFRTVTPVWIHRWIRGDAQSLKWHRGGALLFFGHPPNFLVIRAEKSTILTQIEGLQTVTPVWIHRRLPNDAQSLKWHRRTGSLLFFKVVRQISRSQGLKNWWFGSDLSISGLNSWMAMEWHT